MPRVLACLVPLCLAAAPAVADAPKVVDARAISGFAGWTVQVTISHPDTGWDHYADAFRLEAPDGTVLGVRELTHPHVDEQPFTRMLDKPEIPGNLPYLVLRTRCSRDGWSSETYRFNLP